MSCGQPRYSILIPTRNGIRYLPHAIDSVLSQSSQDFELVVSDNHSSDGTAEYLTRLSDPRLVKLKPDAELPMTHHFEFILSRARGEWVTAIGDDDGLMPFFFAYLDTLDLDRIKAPAIVFRRAYYFWDGCEELYGNSVVSYRPSAKKRYVHNGWAMFLALCSVISYMDMPQLYTTGLVRNDFVRAIKQRSGGRFFFAISPDAASAVIMAIHAPKHFRVEQPIFWTGTSPKSVGFSHGTKIAGGPAIEFQRQNNDVTLGFSNKIPIQLLRKPALSVLVYDALQLCPGVRKVWLSSVAYMFLLAGLISRRGEGRQAVCETYGSSIGWQTLPFRWIIRLATFVRKLDPARIRLHKPLRLDSNDRTRFPTIREASSAVEAIGTA